MNEIHFEYEGKSARLSLQMLKRERAGGPATHIHREVSSVRVLNGQTQTLDKSKLTADDEINGDPELDIERGGVCPRAFHAGLPSPRGKSEIAHEFEEIEIVHTPAGEEKERCPRVWRRPT